MQSVIPQKEGFDWFRKKLETVSSPEERQQFMLDFRKCGEDWGFQPRNRLAGKALFCLTELLFGCKGTLEGLDFCQEAKARAIRGESVAIIGNHLSYGDVNYLMILLEKNGISDYPLMVMAGPKVYSDPFRRLSSMVFDTLKMAQPPSRASDGAEVSMRELATVTRKIIAEAEQWQKQGRILYFFPEGSRSRSGELNRLIAAGSRYFQADSLIYPVGYVGTQGLLGVNSTEISVDKIAIKVGRGIPFAKLANCKYTSYGDQKRKIMDLLGFAIAELLPPEMQGIYRIQGDLPEPELQDSRNCYLTEIQNRFN